MTIDELLAREAIRATLAAYNFSGDRGRADELAEAFAEDGTLEFGGNVYRGRAAIAAAIGGVGQRADVSGAGIEPRVRPFVRHHLTSSRIELRSGNEADAWTYFFVMTPIGPDH